MASSPLSRADMVNSSRGLTGSGTFGMRKEPGRPVFAGPRTTGRSAALVPFIALASCRRIDETYIKVRGKWAYLYRALDKLGNTIDFYLSATRNTKAAKRFLGKALKGLKDWEHPEVLNTDKAPTYAAAIAELKTEGKCPNETKHRQVKYLNNVIEADHGKLKQLIRPVRGFKTLKTAYATIKGFEVMRALRKGQASIFAVQGGILGEARIVERAFGIGPCALTKAMALLQDHLASAAS